jgi:hypothetical protein
MPATVINGIFTGNDITWPNVSGAGTFDGFTVIGNSSLAPQTITGATITGPGAAKFSFDLTQLPVTLNPGQSAILHVKAAGLGAGTSLANLNLALTPGPNTSIQLRGAGAGTGGGQPFPSDVLFPNTKVGQTTTLNIYQIVNVTGVTITVSNIAMVTGTDFFVVGAPIVPFTIPSGGSSAAFSIQFAPSVLGGRNDFLNITTTTPAFTLTTSVVGYGTTLQSAFSLTGATQGSLFSFPGTNAPIVLLADPTNLNSEEPGSFRRIHDFGIVNLEKQLMRVRGHYEDLGPATITVTARARRVGKPDELINVNVAIGTAFADGWIREFTSEPTPISGELIQLIISRAGNSGPISIIDYIPEFEPMGEVIGGT